MSRSMRRPIIAGNWKMNLDRAAAAALAAEVARRASEFPGVDLVVCPPFVYLEAVRGGLAGWPGDLGAQNMYHVAQGAFTGEISPTMLVDLGCRYVILGHSERRPVFHETSADVNKKVLAVLGIGLIPIVAGGELLR